MVKKKKERKGEYPKQFGRGGDEGIRTTIIEIEDRRVIDAEFKEYLKAIKAGWCKRKSVHAERESEESKTIGRLSIKKSVRVKKGKKVVLVGNML